MSVVCFIDIRNIYLSLVSLNCVDSGLWHRNKVGKIIIDDNVEFNYTWSFGIIACAVQSESVHAIQNVRIMTI